MRPILTTESKAHTEKEKVQEEVARAEAIPDLVAKSIGKGIYVRTR